MSDLKWHSLMQSWTKCLIVLLILQSSQVLGGSVENLKNGNEWVRGDPRKGIPGNAVTAGREGDGSIVYVGRAEHNGDLLPAKVVPAYKKAFVSYNSREYVKYNVEILIQPGNSIYQWWGDGNGHVPPNAIIGGHTSSGEILYIGRSNYQGSTVVGKIHPSQQRLYFPYNGGEYSIGSYDVLVRA